MPFQKGDKWNGNKNGRPRQPEIEILRKALENDKTQHGKHLIEEAVEQARTNPNIMIALLKKLIPDKIQGEGFDTGKYIFIIKDKESAEGRSNNRVPVYSASEPANN